MNRHLRLPLELTVKHYSGQRVLLIIFQGQGVPDWCLGLALLKAGLIEALSITDEKSTMLIKIFLSPNAATQRVPRARLGHSSSQIELTDNSLDYVLQFFLKYYRDGTAAVDHIDLDSINMETEKREIYVTFRVPNSMPSRTPEEATALLQALENNT